MKIKKIALSLLLVTSTSTLFGFTQSANAAEINSTKGVQTLSNKIIQ